MSTLPELLSTDVARPVDLLDVYARYDALEKWAKTRKGAVRGRLERVLTAQRDQLGMAPTLRSGADKVLLTDPQPRVNVADVDAWTTWVVATLPDRVHYVMRVDFEDRADAAEALADYQKACTEERWDAAGKHADDFLSLCKAVRVPLLPDGLLDSLLDSGRLRPDGDRVVDVETGEVVAGVTVSTSAPTVQVRVSAASKAAVADELDALLPGGDA